MFAWHLAQTTDLYFSLSRASWKWIRNEDYLVTLFFQMYFVFLFPRPQGKMSLPRTACWETKHLVGRKKNKPLSLFLFSTLAVEKQRKKSVYYPLACSRRTCWCDELSSWVSIYIHKVMGPSRERIWCVRVILLRKCSSLPATQGKCGLK